MTLPFVGDSAKTELDMYQNPLGYIFGTSSYAGGVATEQYYYGYSSSSITSDTYYIPSSLKSVTITGGNILYGAFSGCSGLTSVTIGNGVTSIGGGAFYDCSGLTEITLPFVGASAKIESDTYQYPLGYIFGTRSYAGGVATTQRYYGYSTSSSAEDTYYIPSSLKYVTITGGNILYGAFYNCNSLTSVTIPNSVKSIGSYAFYNCSGLTSVTIPDRVTSIGSKAFYNCAGLTSVTIGNGVTSIGDRAFSGCSGLTEIRYDGDLTGWCGISGLGYLMEYGKSTKTLYIDGTKIEGDLIISEGVKSIGDYAFSGCSGLTSVTIPDSVTSIGSGVFLYCSGLTSVTIGNGVTRIGDGAFSHCDGLTSVTIPDSVTRIGGSAFWCCSGLTSITIGNGVTSIGNWAFQGCSGLTSVTIPDSVTGIGSGAFSGCSGLTSIVVKEGNSKYIAKDNCLIDTSTSTLVLGCKTSVIPNDGSVTSIGDSAFSGCTGLTSVTIPDSVTSIGSYAFYDCTGLTSVTIPDSVTSIGSSAFYGCYKLVEVINNSSLSITKGSSDNGCVAYYALNVKEGGNSKVVNQDGYLFYTYNSVNYLLGYVGTETELTLPNNYNGQNYQIYKYAFWCCSDLTSITIPDSVTSIGDWAFLGCTGLTSIVVKEGNSKYIAKDNCLIDTSTSTLVLGCKTSVIPNDGSVTSIGDGAFYNCRRLTSVTIPDSVTSIGSSAFSDCSRLTSVTIGNKVTSIDVYAFSGCSGLKRINFNGTKAQWNAIKKGDCWRDNTGDFTVYCTDGTLSKSEA